MKMRHDYSSEAFEAAYTYTGSDLGVLWTEQASYFRLWAPTASAVTLNLYASGTEGTNDRLRDISMLPGKNGTWLVCLPGNWNGFYYTYSVCVDGMIVEACDPYAHAVGVNGRRAMILDLRSTDPEGWEQDRDPNYDLKINDIILYELHLRDLSANVHSRLKHRGKYLALTQTGSKTTDGFSTGLDHIKSLGITHLHLLPVFDFGSVDEANPEKHQYNWGYDPMNFNVPEGSYATDAIHGEVRIREFKLMVKALHDNGISIVMDVVYNHVYRADQFSLNRIVPDYFCRFNERGQYTNASGCGNDTASERSMVHKYIVDSVNYWADEYHIDGFRFDLVGLLDVFTIQDIMDSVHEKHPNVKFYGEGWDMAYGITKPNIPMCTQKNAALVPGFAFFNDTIRDSIRGSVFDARIPGYASGDLGRKHSYETCFIAALGWTTAPCQIINYESCHDNYTLFDALRTALPNASRQELVKRNLLAAALNILAQGVPFLHAGEEMLRSKPGTKKDTFTANSYKSPDRVNSLKWEQLSDPDVQTACRYYQGLIRLKKTLSPLHMRTSNEISGCINLNNTKDPALLSYTLYGKNERLFIVFNASNHEATFSLPQGDWEICVKDAMAGVESIEKAEHTISVSPISTVVLIQHRTGNN